MKRRWIKLRRKAALRWPRIARQLRRVAHRLGHHDGRGARVVVHWIFDVPDTVTSRCSQCGGVVLQYGDGRWRVLVPA